jgi:glycosyltransferase involved in cell wall biosynthesis
MTEDLPKVSIVLPTYNGSRRLRQSIESCLNQTYENLELVVIDDGSTDSTPQIVGSYKDQRVRYFRHKKNLGLPRALNAGFAQTHGKYLTWTSDDNEFLPTAIEELLSFLKKSKGADLVYADFEANYWETGFTQIRRMPDTLELDKRNSIGACFLFRRNVYEVIGGYDPRYRLVEDYEYWIRISKRFKAVHYPKLLYLYGEHSKSLTRAKRSGVLLYDAVLRYENSYITLDEFAEQVRLSFSALGSIRKVLSYVPDLVRVSSISLGESLLCFLFLCRALIRQYPRELFGVVTGTLVK